MHHRRAVFFPEQSTVLYTNDASAFLDDVEEGDNELLAAKNRRMKKTGEPEKQIVGRTAKAVKRTRKKLLAKELQNDFVPFKQWQHPSKIVVTLKTGSANKKDRAAIQRAFIEAALDQKADGLSSVQIREVTLESGKVVIEVWNKASQSFALKALKGRSYRDRGPGGLS